MDQHTRSNDSRGDTAVVFTTLIHDLGYIPKKKTQVTAAAQLRAALLRELGDLGAEQVHVKLEETAECDSSVSPVEGLRLATRALGDPALSCEDATRDWLSPRYRLII